MIEYAFILALIAIHPIYPIFRRPTTLPDELLRPGNGGPGPCPQLVLLPPTLPKHSQLSDLGQQVIVAERRRSLSEFFEDLIPQPLQAIVASPDQLPAAVQVLALLMEVDGPSDQGHGGPQRVRVDAQIGGASDWMVEPEGGRGRNGY
jgi:hypothetical protein